MKTKLRRFVSILSAMVLMVCCAVPAFADDIGSSYTTWNDTIKQNVFRVFLRVIKPITILLLPPLTAVVLLILLYFVNLVLL